MRRILSGGSKLGEFGNRSGAQSAGVSPWMEGLSRESRFRKGTRERSTTAPDAVRVDEFICKFSGPVPNKVGLVEPLTSDKTQIPILLEKTHRKHRGNHLFEFGWVSVISICDFYL